jgi:hypothetical protein
MGGPRSWLVSLWLVALIPTVGPSLDLSSSELFGQVRLAVQNLSTANPKPALSVASQPNSTAGAAPAHPIALASSSFDTAPTGLPPASQEITALRTQNSDTYSVRGGYELVSYSGPINYKSPAGSWQAIDDSLVASTTAGFAWQNKANSFFVLLPANLSAGPIEFKDSNGSVSFRLAGAGSTAGQISGSTVSYANALPGVTVQTTAANAGIKESLILSGSTSTSQASYSMSLGSGMSVASVAGGSIDITGPSGNRLYSIDPPTASDAAGAIAP